MSEKAIRIEGLSKRYRIGIREKYPTIRETIMRAVSGPLRKVRSWSSDQGQDSGPRWIWALKDVSIEINHGEVYGIIGPNGSGKSTLLKVLSGITEPTAGYADIHGRVGSLLEVGTGFHMELTGRENIFMNGAILGMSRYEIKRKFDEIVAFSEVEQFLDTPVKRYSSGMYMRLAFAVAAHLDTEIMMVDEVLAVGDMAFQKKCLGKMGDVAKAGRTVLLVSHNMLAVKSLCQRAIWLDEGQLKEIGESNQIVSDYLQSIAATHTQQVWDNVETAPGNNIIRLHRVEVRGMPSSPSAQITMQIPFVIGVEFWNLVPGTHMDFNLQLATEDQIVAFSTSTADEPGCWTAPPPAGLFRAECQIPGNLLNSGLYRVTIKAIKKQSRVVIYRHEDVLAFDVLDLRRRSEGWYGKSPGVVSPLLKWTIEHIGNISDDRRKLPLPS
jgi:lipopolysaccharide transport system ATP-binding protein